MEQKFKSKPIVEAGIMSAIIFVLMLLTTLPAIGVFIAFAIPIPIVLLYLKYDLKTSLCSVLISGALVGLFMGPLYGVQVIITNSIIGIVLGVCVKKNISGVKTLVSLIIANTFGTIAELSIIFSAFTGMTIGQFADQIAGAFNDAAKISESILGNTANANTQMIEIMKSVNADMVLSFMPIAVVSLIVFRAFLNYVVGKAIIKRVGFNINSLPPFSNWFFKPIIVAIVVLINTIVLYLTIKKIIPGYGAFYTMLYVLYIILLIQGLSVVINFLKNKLRMNSVLLAFLGILMVTSEMSVVILSLGIVDVLFDLRGVDPDSFGTYLRNKINTKLKNN